MSPTCVRQVLSLYQPSAIEWQRRIQADDEWTVLYGHTNLERVINYQMHTHICVACVATLMTAICK